MKISIVADGEPHGTRVYAEDGRDLTNMVTAIRWHHAANDLPSAEIDLCMTALSGTVDARMLGPGGKEVRRIEYADGTVDEFGE